MKPADTLVLLAALPLLGAAGCKQTRAAPRDTEDASIEAPPEYECPGRDPRIGATCKAPAKTRCSYQADTCPDGHVYTRTYCCFQGGWEMCGTSEPCPRPDAGEADEPDEAVPDMSADSGADGADGAGDLGPDLAVCDGKPPPAYCAPGQTPCLPCPGGGSVTCMCISATWLCEVCPMDGGTT